MPIKALKDLKPGAVSARLAPPLEHEQPHRALARANSQHTKLTEELRQLKADWAAQNVRAQATRIAISTSEITHVETRRRELHLQLEATQAEIGRLNKEIRERKAEHRSNGTKQQLAKIVEPKTLPFKEDPEFPAYFLLAARESLVPSMYAAVLRVAKAIMGDARKMGLEAPL
jgi:hypothetical protein